jgi:hypothetical protein
LGELDEARAGCGRRQAAPDRTQLEKPAPGELTALRVVSIVMRTLTIPHRSLGIGSGSGHRERAAAVLLGILGRGAHELTNAG